MLVVISNNNNIENEVNKGKAFAAHGHTAFEDETEANEWATQHLGHGQYKLYPLCDCDESNFVDMATTKYKTMKGILKPTLIGKPKA